MATERIRMGFVGAGNNRRRRHIPGFRVLAGVEIVVVARSAASDQTVPVAER